MLGHFCALLVVERALAKLVTCSPIGSIDPITAHAAAFVFGERSELSLRDALKLVGRMSLAPVRGDIPRQFPRYDRNMVV